MLFRNVVALAILAPWMMRRGIVEPFQFSRMIFATAIGSLMFAEFPDVWTWIGSAVIFAASYYVVLRVRNGKLAPGDREQA